MEGNDEAWLDGTGDEDGECDGAKDEEAVGENDKPDNGRSDGTAEGADDDDDKFGCGSKSVGIGADRDSGTKDGSSDGLVDGIRDPRDGIGDEESGKIVCGKPFEAEAG